MLIDENKERTPYRDDSKAGNPIYTDHNMMTLELNLKLEKEDVEKHTINRKNMDEVWKIP